MATWQMGTAAPAPMGAPTPPVTQDDGSANAIKGMLLGSGLALLVIFGGDIVGAYVLGNGTDGGSAESAPNAQVTHADGDRKETTT